MYNEDTIASISTPIGDGAIGIVRMSGPESVPIVRGLFRGPLNGDFKSHRFYYGSIVDPADGQIVDEVLTVAMLAPRSYTREDVVEIHCHGGALTVRRIYALLLAFGARPAGPGEFTRRAFLNGRIDLTQAEAVLDIIQSRTDSALALAQHQREGFLSSRIALLRESLIYSLAMLEAFIDFPEDELDHPIEEDIRLRIEAVVSELTALRDGFRDGKLLRDGVTVMIAGYPNVGKSSLLNALLKERRAIVTSVPGTTRDIIEDYLNIKGLPVRILDTAGIRDTDDPVESEGVKLVRERIPLADLILFVIDSSRPLMDADRSLFLLLKDRPLILLLNKADLGVAVSLPAEMSSYSSVSISTVTGEGIEELRSRIHDAFISSYAHDSREYIAVTNVRHHDLIVKALQSLKSFSEIFHPVTPLEILSVLLREALDALGEVTGETATDDILDIIFERFCIGK